MIPPEWQKRLDDMEDEVDRQVAIIRAKLDINLWQSEMDAWMADGGWARLIVEAGQYPERPDQ